MTSVDDFVAEQYKKDKNAFVDPTQNAIEKAILAAKTGDIAGMEDALGEEIDVDSIDQFGNSLFLLSAQQVCLQTKLYLSVFFFNVFFKHITSCSDYDNVVLREAKECANIYSAKVRTSICRTPRATRRCTTATHMHTSSWLST